MFKFRSRKRRKTKSAKGHMLFIPEELTFAAPESPEFNRLLAELAEAMTRPLEPQCPICAEERKGYACVFPPVSCPHSVEESQT